MNLRSTSYAPFRRVDACRKAQLSATRPAGGDSLILAGIVQQRELRQQHPHHWFSGHGNALVTHRAAVLRPRWSAGQRLQICDRADILDAADNHATQREPRLRRTSGDCHDSRGTSWNNSSTSLWVAHAAARFTNGIVRWGANKDRKLCTYPRMTPPRATPTQVVLGGNRSSTSR